MKIIDISMPVYEEMPVYKNKDIKRPVFDIISNFEKENGTRETRLSIELHTGTHMDAPLHMIKGGMDSEFFKVEDMIVKCRVIDFTHLQDHISKVDLVDKSVEPGDFLLFKTKNSYDEGFNHSFIYVEKSGAEYLADMKIKGVGIDSLGIERSQPDHITHKTFLGNGIYILEGLRLKDVKEGIYTLVAAPINIKNVEASPVRALLIDTII